MAPRILIFSMAMGADYSFELIFIETNAPQFIGNNTFFLGSVHCAVAKIHELFFRHVTQQLLAGLEKLIHFEL